MKIDIMDINKFIEVNNIQEVSDPFYFEKGNYPTSKGLFSYEIFGRPGSYDRKTIYGYIDLKGTFIHPLVYKTLIRLNRKLEDLISGLEYFKIDSSGEIVPAEETDNGAGTGIDFLYNNWSKVKLHSTDSHKRDERLNLINNLKKNEIFIDKWIVMPAFYRDANLSNSSSGIINVDTINQKYARLIRLAKGLEENSSSGIEFVSNSTKGTIQASLVDIFDSTIGLTKKKSGLFRQAVMGKSIDYAARNVISAPSYGSANKYTDMKVDMEHTGVPISTTMSLFNPFIIKATYDYFNNYISNKVNTIDNKTGELLTLDKNFMDDFSQDKIKEKINRFIKSPSERFEIIQLKYSNGEYKKVSFELNTKSDAEAGKPIKRFLTWTDVFFMVCCDVVKDKYVYITRYPLEDYFGCYPSKVTVLSTIKTQPLYVAGNFYEFYPIVDTNMDKADIAGYFIDSTQPYSTYLNGLGGDFDGDMITLRGVFTKEANLEAERILKSKSHILNIDTSNNRLMNMECIQTIYDLTKD